MQHLLLKLTGIAGICLFVFIQEVSGQMSFLTDTLELRVFTLEVPREKAFDIGNRKTRADSALKAHYSGGGLAGLLNGMAPLNIKHGGTTGALSTFSMRGAGGSRTLVTWNGLPLNSLTSGDVNLSLLNASAFNRISINHSAPSTLYGSSSSGGVLELNNEPEFKPETRIAILQNAGSFKTLQSALAVNLGSDRFYSSTRLWRNSSENNFEYFDTYYYSPMRRRNAGHNSHGAISSNSLRFGSNQIISLGLWYQNSDAKLPPNNGSHPNMKQSRQTDRSFRSFAKWVMEKKSFYGSVKGYYFNESLLFTQKLDPSSESFDIYSEILAEKRGVDAELRYHVNHWLLVDFGSTLSQNSADGTNHMAKPVETSLAVFSAARVQLNRFKGVASIRKEQHTFYDPPLRFGLGAEYALFNNLLNLRGALNQKFRVPTFNDKYWPASGNPGIRPERGITGEAGAELTLNTGRLFSTIEVTAYHNLMSDIISWLPADGGLWVPKNVSGLTAKGIESSIKGSYTFINGLKITESLAFDLNSSESEESPGMQLFYTPKYRGSSTSTASFKNASVLFSFLYISRRKIDETGFSLPQYYQSNLSARYLIPLKWGDVNLSFKLNNVFNHTEPYVKDYPHAGRNYMFGIELVI